MKCILLLSLLVLIAAQHKRMKKKKSFLDIVGKVGKVVLDKGMDYIGVPEEAKGMVQGVAGNIAGMVMGGGEKKEEEQNQEQKEEKPEEQKQNMMAKLKEQLASQVKKGDGQCEALLQYKDSVFYKCFVTLKENDDENENYEECRCLKDSSLCEPDCEKDFTNSCCTKLFTILSPATSYVRFQYCCNIITVNKQCSCEETFANHQLYPLGYLNKCKATNPEEARKFFKHLENIPEDKSKDEPKQDEQEIKQREGKRRRLHKHRKH